MSTTTYEEIEGKRGLAEEVAVIRTRLDSMEEKQNAQDRLLLGDENSPGLKTLMYSMNSNLRLIKWLIGMLIAGLTLYFGIREAEHRGMAERQMQQLSTNATIPNMTR